MVSEDMSILWTKTIFTSGSSAMMEEAHLMLISGSVNLWLYIQETSNIHRANLILLAAMSSSRSDIVTQFVRSSVRPFFSLVSLKFLLVLKSFNGVSRLFKGGFKDVSRKF